MPSSSSSTSSIANDPWLATHIHPKIANPIHASIPFDDDNFTSIQLQNCLDAYGYVIIRQVLNIDECNHTLDLAWDYIEAASAAEKDLFGDCEEDVVVVNRKEESTHAKGWPCCVEGGILPYYGAGHSSMCWFVRSNKKVRRVFEKLLSVHHGSSSSVGIGSNANAKAVENDDDQMHLLASMEGMILWHKEQKSEPGWFHIDQNPRSKPDVQSYQSIVNILPTNSMTGGNVVVEGSHLLFPKYYTSIKSHYYDKKLNEVAGDDWLEINAKDTHVLNEERILCCNLLPGDMLIWNSRLVHCSYPSTHLLESNNNTDTIDHPQSKCLRTYGLKRAAVILSMSKNIPTDNVLLARRRASERCESLTHWIDKVSTLGGERIEEVEKEPLRASWMRKNRPGTLLCFKDLDEDQKQLVTIYNKSVK